MLTPKREAEIRQAAAIESDFTFSALRDLLREIDDLRAENEVRLRRLMRAGSVESMLKEVWIIECEQPGEECIESVWATPTEAQKETERLRAEHGYGFSMTCYQVQGSMEGDQ